MKTQQKTQKLMGFMCNGVQWLVDPTSSFTHVPPNDLVHALGLIPTFLHDEMEDVISEAVYNYGYCSFDNDMKGGTVGTNGAYSYPGDPVLKPIAVAVLPEQGFNVYVYSYGMITFYNLTTNEYKTYFFD